MQVNPHQRVFALSSLNFQSTKHERDMGALRTSQAEAMAEEDRGLADLERQYQANVSSAIADNDYRRAQALMNEYNNGYSRDLSTAKTLAAYGDFSGYASLYGQETANNMAALWKAQNPDLAYNTGRMTAEEYKAITGKYPAGYQPAYVPQPDPQPDIEGGGKIVVNDVTMKGIRDTIYRSGSQAAAMDVLRKSPDIVDAMSDDQWKQVQSWIMQMG